MMRRKLSILAVLAMAMGVMLPAAAGAADPDGYMFEISDDGTYAVDEGRQTDGSSMEATVTVLLDGTWHVDGSVTDGDLGTYTFAVGTAGTCVGNTPLFDFTISSDPGETALNDSAMPSLPASYDFIRIYPSDQLCQTVWSQPIPTQPYGMITAPEADSVALGSVTLGATYYDDDFDEAQWAVRPYSPGCPGGGGDNVAAGGPGVADPSGDYHWNGRYFSATLDTTDWDPGYYCFVFNTQEDGGENDVRLIRNFYVGDAHISVGGQLIEGSTPKDVTAQITVGGWLTALADAVPVGGADTSPDATISDSADLPCEWNIVLHDVAGTNLDGSHFVGYTCTELNTYVPEKAGTDGVVNLTVQGTLDGVDGYRAILRLEDYSEPATGDTIRIEIFNSGGKIYDTDGGDFTRSSNNVGLARTELDRGNIQIDYY